MYPLDSSSVARLRVSPLHDNLYLTVSTTNIRTFSFDPFVTHPGLVAGSDTEDPKTIQIDDTFVTLPRPLSLRRLPKPLSFHRATRSSAWALVLTDHPSLQPRPIGPMIQITTTSSPLLLIVPARDPPRGSPLEQHISIARRIARDAWVYGRLDAEIVDVIEVRRRCGRLEGNAGDTSGEKSLMGNWVLIGGWENELVREEMRGKIPSELLRIWFS